MNYYYKNFKVVKINKMNKSRRRSQKMKFGKKNILRQLYKYANQIKLKKKD